MLWFNLSNLTPLTDVFFHLFQGPLSGPEYGPTFSPPLTKHVIGGRFSVPFFGLKNGTAIDHYFFTRKSVFLPIDTKFQLVRQNPASIGAGCGVERRDLRLAFITANCHRGARRRQSDVFPCLDSTNPTSIVHVCFLSKI